MAEAALDLVEKEQGIDLDVMEAYSLLAQGKRNLLCGEVPNAVNQLQEACRVLASKFGDTADECGEVYYTYGKALLELSRMESGVLGNALQGVEEDEEEKSSTDEKSTGDDKSTVDDKSTGDDKSTEEKTDDRIEKDDLTDEQKEKISEEVLDAMLETDEELKARTDKDKSKEESGKEGESKDEGKKDEDKMDEDKMDEDKKDEDKKDEGNKEEGNKEEGNKEEGKKDECEKDEDKMETETETPSEDKKENLESEKKPEKSESEKENEEGKVTDEKVEATDEKKSSDGKEEEMETEKEGETSQDDDDKEGEESGEEGTEEEGEGTEEEEGENKEGGSEKKEEEDVSNLQLAWEMLELSKIIYKRNSNKESKMKLADTFLKLGEVGLETEQYETAISDFKECLKIQKEVMDAEDRALAETYYQLGLACAFNAQYDDAISNYRSASSTIEAKIASLKKVTEKADEESKGKEPANADDPVVKAQKELKDLQDIIPDIMAKIEDVLDERRSADTVKKMVKDSVAADLTEQTTTGFSDSSEKSGAAAPMDISHLVRKKRKPEDDAEDVTKKAKTDSTDKAEVNGSDAAPVVNGSGEVAAVNGSAKVNGVAPEVKAS